MSGAKIITHVTLEDALEKTGFGKFNYGIIILTGAILGSVFLETVSINFILPIAQCDLMLTTSDKGILSGIGFVGIIISSHFWGFMADTRGEIKRMHFCAHINLFAILGRRTVIVPTLFSAFVSYAICHKSKYKC